MRRAITKRYNAIKTLSRKWSDSNIPSTINELNIMKDTSITNDFLIYAIINREDISLFLSLIKLYSCPECSYLQHNLQIYLLQVSQ